MYIIQNLGMILKLILLFPVQIFKFKSEILTTTY